MGFNPCVDQEDRDVGVDNGFLGHFRLPLLMYTGDTDLS